MHQNTYFLDQKIRKFSGDGHSPSSDPFPVGRGHPSPYAIPQVPPLQLDPGYATAPIPSSSLSLPDSLPFGSRTTKFQLKGIGELPIEVWCGAPAKIKFKI